VAFLILLRTKYIYNLFKDLSNGGKRYGMFNLQPFVFVKNKSVLV